MPKDLLHELNTVVETVRTFSTGASIENIMQTLPSPISRRTLQRRLALLVKEHRLFTEGKAQAIRYKIAPHLQKEELSDKKYYGYISLSATGEYLKQSISEPLYIRQSIGYNCYFLTSYKPNVTFYLPEALRNKLADMGKTSHSQQPAGTFAKQILNRLLIDLSWNSSRLEGNTYSLLETERLLELGEPTAGKKVMEAHMILNHKAAIEFMVESAENIAFDRRTILDLHALLSYNLLSSPMSCGRLRNIPVAIGGTNYLPLNIPQLVEECFEEILTKASQIINPFEQAFFAMVHLPYLQPFEDVNKRVSRMAANIPLIRHNLCPLSFIDLPTQAYIDGTLAVYELNDVALLRDVFEWAYEHSAGRYAEIQQMVREADPFKLRYYRMLINVVANVIKQLLSKRQAAEFIQQQAVKNIPEVDRAKFIENAEINLMSMHEGNIAPFRISPEEFDEWQKYWR